jgi:hexosaminidase
LAQLKMNYFHWHLTDDQGWRIEIKKYPKLTSVGAWRIEKDGSRYGGYYTQDDIREIVEYARQRYITIIPEIEMPGHSSAAIAAYPWLCFDDSSTIVVLNTWGVKKEIYSVKDSTFMFLKDVLDEVCSLFPGKYLHIGGDEVPKQRWKNSAVAQKVKETHHLKNEEELQHYFMNRIEDYLATKGKQCIGWGEIVKGGLSSDVVVMSWLDKKAGIKAAKKGNQVIMAPRFFCYFDYPQSIGDKKHAWWMTYLPLRKVYHFEPIPKRLPAEQRKLILGGQANVWTEYITNVSELSYQVVPRIEAMAEALWSNTKNYQDFKKRLAVLMNDELIVP